MRQARRVHRGESCGLCFACLHSLPPRGAPDDADRAFWLQRFTDEEVVMLAWALDGGYGSVEAVAVWRRKLRVRSRSPA